jgi:hypothetical protein
MTQSYFNVLFQQASKEDVRVPFASGEGALNCEERNEIDCNA